MVVWPRIYFYNELSAAQICTDCTFPLSRKWFFLQTTTTTMVTMYLKHVNPGAADEREDVTMENGEICGAIGYFAALPRLIKFGQFYRRHNRRLTDWLAARTERQPSARSNPL